MSSKNGSKTLEEYIEICGKAANEKGWKVNWENFPIFMALTAHEILDAIDKGWRDDNAKKAEEEIADSLIRLFHICYDMSFDINVLNRVIRNNRKRVYHHGRKRL